MINATRPGYQGQVAPSEAPAYFPPRGTCDRVNVSRLPPPASCRLASSRGITVYWLLPPIVSSVQARRERLGFDRPYRDVVRGDAGSVPERDGHRWPARRLPAGVFVDPSHCDARGAAALQRRRCGGAPPTPTPMGSMGRLAEIPAVATPLEDMEQLRNAGAEGRRPAGVAVARVDEDARRVVGVQAIDDRHVRELSQRRRTTSRYGAVEPESLATCLDAGDDRRQEPSRP